jgi:hypothetical protein
MIQFRRKEKTNAFGFVFGKALQLFQPFVSSLCTADGCAITRRHLSAWLSPDTRDFIAQTPALDVSYTLNFNIVAQKISSCIGAAHGEDAVAPVEQY